MQTLVTGPDNVHQAMLPIVVIVPSATNPRKRISDQMIEDLAISIARVGVLQPILVRPHPTTPEAYQIVAGECRYRAAVKAGLDNIPATIRDLTDLEALELQVLENLYRNDLHPLEEAEGFQQLLDANGYTAQTLASKIGKSKGYVYASLKLCDLSPAGREVFYEGKLTASTALLIARIPGEALQAQALNVIAKPGYNGEIPSYRDAVRIVHDRFTLDLTRANFDPEDMYLVQDAGDCAACPKRSGNARELFPDIKSADVCTDTTCFQKKREAHIEHVKALPTSIIGDEAKRILPYSYSFPESTDYARPESSCGDKTWTELLGDELPTRAIMHDGMKDPVVLVDVVAAKQLLEEKGIQVERETEKEETLNPYQIERREREAARTAEQERRGALLAVFHNRLEDGAVLRKILAMAFPLMIASFFENLNPDERELFFGARGKKDWLPSDSAQWVDRISELFNKDQSRLLIELFAVSDGEGVLDPGYYWDPENDRKPDIFNAILSAAGIDPDSKPAKTPTDTASAAHAEQETAREEDPEEGAETAAQVGEPSAEPNPGATQIEAAYAASQRAAKTPAAGAAEVLS